MSIIKMYLLASSTYEVETSSEKTHIKQIAIEEHIYAKKVISRYFINQVRQPFYEVLKKKVRSVLRWH